MAVVSNCLHNSTQIAGNVLSSNRNVLKSLKGFRIGHLNITSLVRHVDELRIYMEDKPFDILSINQSCLDDTVNLNTVNIQSYEIFTKSRNREGDGVALYCRDNLTVINRTDLVPVELEAVCLEVIKPKFKPILIVSVYRPPNTSIELFEKIEILFQNVENDRKEVIIVGDLNCDLISVSNYTKRLNDLLNVFQMTQLIKEPTRITNTSATLIDVAIVSKPKNIGRSGVLHIGISDHSLIYVRKKISFAKKDIKTVNTRNYRNYIQQNFIADLSYHLALLNWENNDPCRYTMEEF